MGLSRVAGYDVQVGARLRRVRSPIDEEDQRGLLSPAGARLALPCSLGGRGKPRPYPMKDKAHSGWRIGNRRT